MAVVTLGGNPINTSGELPKVGSKAIDFKLVQKDLSIASLANFAGSKLVLNIFPSIDTGTCATSVRKFNEKDKEWDVTPLNKEVIGTSYLWLSPDDGRLYLPFQRVVNAGIGGPENIKGIPDYTSYYLDIKNKQWVKLGQLEKEVIDIIKKLIFINPSS